MSARDQLPLPRKRGTPNLSSGAASIPARRKIVNPFPLCKGLGSCTPATTRLMPTATMASVQGGVRPCVQHGSRVTYSVAPLGSWPCACASRRAAISACGRPARWCQPRPMTRPALHDHRAHHGVGRSGAIPRRASRRASRTNFRSLLTVIIIRAGDGEHFPFKLNARLVDFLHGGNHVKKRPIPAAKSIR